MMVLEKGSWSGGFVDGDGGNVYPYKVENSSQHRPKDIHQHREEGVVEAEKEDIKERIK